MVNSLLTRESEGEGSSRVWGGRGGVIYQPFAVNVVTSPVTDERIPQGQALVIEDLHRDSLPPVQRHSRWMGVQRAVEPLGRGRRWGEREEKRWAGKCRQRPTIDGHA